MERIKKLIYQWVDNKFLDGCSSYNSLEVRKNSRSKVMSREMFARLNVPHAKGAVFLSPGKAFRFVKEHGFPVVIKPNVSGFSRGSHFPIRNYRELLKASLLVKVWWPFSIIEEYLEGHNYRVVAIRNEIMAVIERYPPFVIGNGKDDIKTLINAENKIREEMQLMPCMHPIPMSRDIRQALAKQGLKFSSVPDKSRRINIINKIALKPGGIVETLDPDKMHPDNRDLCLKLLDGFNANILGVDIIMSDTIEKSHEQQNCIFLEVNSRPYLKMHDFPRYGDAPDLANSYQQLDALNIEKTDVF